ncbi:MAG: hypothetical protein KF767_16255 [Bdellovibrionaceae bacterium]|nr:hypothetical protein [Pseudobdellovibrionaceae bacterium]
MERKFRRANYLLWKKRERTPFGEVDLWFKSPDGREDLLIEVKSLKHEALLPERLGARQRQRLTRVLEGVSAMSGRARLIVVFVRPDGSMIELGLEDFVPVGASR